MGPVMSLDAALRVALARLGIAAPISVGFELTHLCNLECSYCDRHTPMPGEMTLDQIRAALSELHELGMRHVSLDGGEPLAHREIARVVDWLCGMRDVRVYMNTNGILVPRKLDVVRRLSRVKISLDGPATQHDAVRGAGSHARAVRGALAARDAGVSVELTCVIGKHNAGHVDELLDQVEALGFAIVFQPARNSLFLDTERDGSAFVPDAVQIRQAFSRIEARKRAGGPVANRWSSLRHFRGFPGDAAIPCAAGTINVTLDPAGNLFPCGQVSRADRSNNVVALGAKEAFRRLRREGCAQCWCARVVEENVAWGGRIDRMLPPLGGLRGEPREAPSPSKRRLPVV